ncbi:MAG TPA: DNA primase [Thermogutta sp.]|nr:DNA primase [Thermogutta sp.]HOP76551.1 DNA primase [Thermogutta sp.]HPU06685.1 DNA primase [Thermogutta sp.]HQF14007.1 DNA primase [Thermogutta sp.]
MELPFAGAVIEGLPTWEPISTMPLTPYSDVKEQIRQAIDIVDLVERYIPLRRQGRGFVGLCPWHDDHRPSLQVNPQRQSFRCFVCDIGGDIFTFMMKIENVEFPEAMAMLAEMAGIPLPRGIGRGSAVSQQKQDLYRVMAWAEQQYHQCLLEAPEAAPAREYLASRQISPASIAQFRLGFSPLQPDWLLRRARRDQIDPKDLVTTGILVGTPGRDLIDRFRGRVLFSIRDSQGRTVGFGGRILPHMAEQVPAKYVNSPETPLFSKSRLLYGLDVARDAFRRTGTALVMEGYTDVIMAHQCGFHNAVAVLGTALTDAHLQVLQRFVDRVILVLDGDEAGRRRAAQVLELFVARQIDLRVLTLPDDLDPCDFLLKYGAPGFQDALDTRTVDALEHAFAAATHGVDLERDIDGVTRAVDRLLMVMAKAPAKLGQHTAQQQAREWKILSRLSVMTRIDESVLRKRLEELRRGGRSRTAAVATPAPKTTLDGWHRTFLEFLVTFPDAGEKLRAAFQPEQIEIPLVRRIFEIALDLLANGKPADFDHLMLAVDDPLVHNILVDVDQTASEKRLAEQNPEEILRGLLRAHEERVARARGSQLTHVLRQGGLDPEQQIDLLKRIVEQERNRQKWSEPMDG